MGGYSRYARDKPNLRFEETGDTGKTKTWCVISNHSGQDIADIRWYGAWRRYALFPEENTVWDNNCMSEVCTFIETQMRARRESKKAVQP
jgi:hypothetical protein